MIRRNIFKWHRITSLIIALPVLCWAISGFMHPLMTNVRPRVSMQTLNPVEIDSSIFQFPLPAALQQAGIPTIHNTRLVHIDTNWFYQVQLHPDEEPVYLSTLNGNKLNNGDAIYARYLAKQLLEGQPLVQKKPVQFASIAAEPQEVVSADPGSGHDCCDAATACVLMDTSGNRAYAAERITNFGGEYKSVNRLLPVYKVNFDRADGIRLYVETTQDRLAFSMDNKRAFFDSFFGIFHTWEWMNGGGSLKYLLMTVITLLALLSTIMGLYIFFITKTKKGNSPVAKSRRLHRYVSLTASIFTMMFIFSGGLHAWEKVQPQAVINDRIAHRLPATKADFNLNLIQQALEGKPVRNFSIVRIDSFDYWRVLVGDVGKKNPAVEYISIDDNTRLTDGDETYARHLASVISGLSKNQITATSLVSRFSGEYGFINKRLPVWKINFPTNSNERYYIETSTGKLAAHVTDDDLLEGYSFALLHKHHFMDWGGKVTRDISTMVAAGLQVVMVAVGLILFVRWRKNMRKNRQRTDPPAERT